MTIYTTLYLRGTGRANGAEEIKVSEHLRLNIAVHECVYMCSVLPTIAASLIGLIVAWFHSLNFWSEVRRAQTGLFQLMWTLFLQYSRVKRYSETLSAALKLLRS